jgi:hypothetical protein
MFLECLMGHQEMPPDHQDWHFKQLPCERTDAANPEFLELISVVRFHSEGAAVYGHSRFVAKIRRYEASLSWKRSLPTFYTLGKYLTSKQLRKGEKRMDSNRDKVMQSLHALKAPCRP